MFASGSFFDNVTFIGIDGIEDTGSAFYRNSGGYFLGISPSGIAIDIPFYRCRIGIGSVGDFYTRRIIEHIHRIQSGRSLGGLGEYRSSIAKKSEITG